MVFAGLERRLEQGAPSATAQRVATRRAAHQLLDQPRVFDDPFALTVIGKAAAQELEASLDAQQTPWNRGLRVFMVARSRYAEDRLAVAYGAGMRQYVVLGAGLDTFALRNPYTDLAVFEVDHPATQAWKRARLAEVGAAPRPGLAFAPVDFQSQRLADGLAAAGFDARRPAFFSWLGVAMYLPEQAVFETLAFVAGLPSPSEIVFDFMVRPELMSPASRLAAEALGRSVAELGEPFRSAFDPADLVGSLRAAGFAEAETLDAAALNRLYFDGRADGLKLTGSGRLARARV
jgi:methyltransferase (TIGR00027 family)